MATPRNKNTSAAGSKASTPTALLAADHRKVEALFESYESARQASQKTRIAQEICLELTIHAMLEEEIFYPAMRKAVKDAEDALDEAQVEHDSVKILLAELQAGSPKDDFYDAKVKVLSEYVKHHVEEEEKTSESLFSQARDAGLDTQDLFDQMVARKEELTSEFEETGPGLPEVVSFTAVELEEV